MRYCTKCGNQVNENSKFCSKCGAMLDLGINTSGNMYVTNVGERIQKDHSKVKMIVVCILSTILLMTPFIPLLSANFTKMIKSSGTDGTGYEYDYTPASYDYTPSVSSNEHTVSYYNLFMQLHYRMRYYNKIQSEAKESYNKTIDQLTEERKNLKVSDFEWSSDPERDYEDRYNELGERIKSTQNAIDDLDSYNLSLYLIIMLIIVIVVALIIFSCIYNVIRMLSKLSKNNNLFWKYSKRCGLKFIIAYVLFFLGNTILMNLEIKQDKLWGDSMFNTFKNFEYGFLYLAVVAVSIFVFVFSIYEYRKISLNNQKGAIKDGSFDQNRQ